MKNLKSLVLFAAVALTVALSGERASAQAAGGGGGFGGGAGGMGMDPTMIFQMIVDGQRDALGLTNNDDWLAVSPRLLKVVTLQMQARTEGMQNMFAGMRAQGGAAGGPGAGGAGAGRAGRMAGIFGGDPDPSEAELQKALDDHAPSADVKAALTKVRAVRERKKAEMAKAQSDLRDLLNTRQEATLVAAGLLD